MNTSKKHVKPLIGVAFVTVAVCVALTLGSTTQLPAPQRLFVNYADLDVNTAGGAAVLYHRIRVAAAEACAIYGSRDLAHKALSQSCTERAVVETVAQLNDPVLSERYLSNVRAVAYPEVAAVRSAE